MLPLATIGTSIVTMAASAAASDNSSTRRLNSGKKLLQKASRRLDGDQQFDGSSSIKFSQCVDIKTLPYNYQIDDDTVLSSIRSEKMVSTKSYVLFNMCYGGTCYEDEEYIVDINTYTKNIASYHANYQGSICQACNRYADYCSSGNDDGGNNYGYNNNNNNYGNRELKNFDCDECEQYDCFSQYNYNSYNNAINNLIDDVSDCLRTGSYAKNGKELYVGPMCSAKGDGVELALFLDNTCSTYTTQKSFDSLPSYYMYSSDYVFDAMKYSFQKAFSDTDTTSCADLNIGSPYNNANDDGGYGGEMNAYCQQLFEEGEAISLSSCSASNDDQNGNYYSSSNQNSYGSYGGDDFLGWYTYDMTVANAQDINEVCSTISQMGGSYNNYYDKFRSGTWYSNKSGGSYYLDAGNAEKGAIGFFSLFFLVGAVVGGVFLYKKRQEKMSDSKQEHLTNDTFDDSVQTVGVFT